MTVQRCPSPNIAIDRSISNLWTIWACNPPIGHTYEDVCDPKYFGPHRTRFPKAPRANDGGLRIGDVICIRPQDNAWQAERVVTDIIEGSDDVFTEEINFVSFEAIDVPRGYEINHRGPQHRWCIELNGETIERGFVTAKSASARARYFEAQSNAHKRVAAAREKPPAKRGRPPKNETAEVSEDAA